MEAVVAESTRRRPQVEAVFRDAHAHAASEPPRARVALGARQRRALLRETEDVAQRALTTTTTSPPP